MTSQRVKNDKIIVILFILIDFLMSLIVCYNQSMGNKDSTQHSHPFERFKPRGKVQLYHFGELQRYYDQLTHQDVIKAVYQFTLETDNEVEFTHKLKISNNNCPYLINMVKIQTKNGQICSGSSAYHIYFEYLPMTLQNMLQQRLQPLPESQVKLILSCLLQAILCINQRQTYHGDIFPDFIYLDDRGNRRYKIFDSAYFNPLKHGYYRAYQQASFCSPQVLSNVSERRNFPLYNHFVSDTFSIGLVALYAMTLINPVTAYKKKSKEIDYYYIEMLLRIATQNGYSQHLISCVSECVQLKNRPTVSQVLKSYPDLRGGQSFGKFSLRK